MASSNQDSVFIQHDKSTDSFGTSESLASGSRGRSLSEKLKPTQNAFESPGLLYAHPVKKSSKHVVETLEPAEAATEALLAEEKLAAITSQRKSRHKRVKADKRGESLTDQSDLSAFSYGEVH